MSASLARVAQTYDFKRVGGGLLAQSPDARTVQASDLRIVTRLKPTKRKSRYAVRLARAKHVKSNAIVSARAAVRSASVRAR